MPSTSYRLLPEGLSVSALRPSRWKKLGVIALIAPVLVAGTACGTDKTSTASRTASGSRTPAGSGDLGRQLRNLKISSRKHIGAFALDTGTGRTAGYRMHERFPSLSTFKAIEAAAILNKAHRADPALLDRVIHWKASDEVAGSPSTQGHGTAGMTVAQLCQAAITVSDNTAANLLLKRIGGPAGLTRYYRSLHDRISRLDHTEPALNDWRPGDRDDTTTAASMGGDLYQVTLGRALAAEDRKRLIGWLRETATGAERIRAGLPKDWTVGDKTGTASPFAGAHDIAIAWPPSGAPLIIAIYTYGDQGAAIDNKVISNTAALLVSSLGKTS